MMERVVLQRIKWDGFVVPHSILRRRAGSQFHYFKVLEFQNNNFICEEVKVSIIRRWWNAIIDLILNRKI